MVGSPLASLHLGRLLGLRVVLGLRQGVGFGLGRLRDVKDDADAQVELSQDGAQLRDQVELHDLAQQRVVSGGVSPELQGGGREEGSRRKRVRILKTSEIKSTPFVMSRRESSSFYVSDCVFVNVEGKANG